MPSVAYEPAACPACGSGHERQLAGAEEIRAEMEALWAFHTKRLRAGAPPEHLADRVAFSQRPPLRVAACAECGLVFRNPRERAHELAETYAGDEVADAVYASLLATQRETARGQAERLTSALGRCGEGLEVGSFVGGFLSAARDAGWRFEGVDINPKAAAFACRQGFRVMEGTLDDVPPNRRYDAVAIWNTFEQLADPRAAARSARALLRDGGMLALRVPNGAFYAALRSALGGPAAPVARALLAHNNLLGFPYRHGFTPASLDRLLGATGFRVVRTFGDTLVPIADRWTRPWAAAEERAIKLALRGLVRLGAGVQRAPWFEV